ncbi:hypothetical protein BRC68_06705 [Halobacteriales archaeon QH_6_64_20]|nr:MAG: hypothetical protein BRC68_06705 [Halobacteriales archaeon QH_6_64_20]
MRILCDQNVDRQYTETFRRTDWITVVTVADVLSHDAPDTEVSAYAQDHEWVVFTEDDDYLAIDDDRGVVLYRPTERPTPGAIVAALEVIADVYADHRGIETYVPGEWA